MSEAAAIDPPGEAHGLAHVPAPAAVRGLVDNAAGSTIYGWAWDAANPEARLGMELRLGEAIVARAIADRPRADLAKAGIGDGEHAFEFPLTPDLLDCGAQLAVLAIAPDGSAVPISVQIRRPAPPEVLPAPLHQAVTALLASEHATRVQLDELARRLSGLPGAGLQAELAAGQAALAERLEQLELQLARLELLFAAPPATAEPPRGARHRRVPGLVAMLLATALLLVLLMPELRH
jgi:hypothetical protein